MAELSLKCSSAYDYICMSEIHGGNGTNYIGLIELIIFFFFKLRAHGTTQHKKFSSYQKEKKKNTFLSSRVQTLTSV